MTPEEVALAHEDLKSQIDKVVLMFAAKHSFNVTDESNYQLACIMQSVMTGKVSDLEYQTGRIAPFTRHQTDHICYQIGDWYMMMKPLLEVAHNLGFMKEKLKNMICGEG